MNPALSLRNSCLLICCLCLFSIWAWAQPSGDIIQQIENSTPLERALAQAEVLTDVLGLSPEQTEKLIKINLKYSNRVQRLIEKGVEDTVMLISAQEFAQEKDEEIKNLLTKEQLRRYERHKAKLRKIVRDVIQERNR